MHNRVELIGHLGQDPIVRRLDNGTAVAKLSIATSDSYKDKNGEWQNTTEWHNVVLWHSAAENAEKYLEKGKKVTIFGKLKTRKWQDKNGNDRWTTEVHSTKLIFNFEIQREGHFPSAADAPPAYNKQPATVTADTNAPASNAAEDDLPF